MMLWAKIWGFSNSCWVGLVGTHRRSVLVRTNSQLQCTKCEFSSSNIFFAIFNPSSFTEIIEVLGFLFASIFRFFFHFTFALHLKLFDIHALLNHIHETKSGFVQGWQPCQSDLCHSCNWWTSDLENWRKFIFLRKNSNWKNLANGKNYEKK